MCKTTVIIPNWSGLSDLKECLKTLKKQTSPFRLVIVDNGSADGSGEFLKSQAFQENFPETDVVLLPENTGFCHAVNLGVSKARTKYIFLLNNDTKIRADCIEKLEKAIEGRKEVFAVQALMLSADGKKIDSAGDSYLPFGYALSRLKGKAYQPSQKYPSIRKVFSCCAGAALYRRKCFQTLGGLDEAHFAYLEDVDLGWRAANRGYGNYLCKEAIVLHKGSASTGSRHNPFKTYHAARNNVYVLYKNMPPLFAAINLPLIGAGMLVKAAYFAPKGLGKDYIKGIRDGVEGSIGKRAPIYRTSFQWKRWKQYLGIQINLYHNIIDIFSVRL
ncbi:MAG: glycosyltransferase family 2 protein [Lachnospiraceae bacterium]|nr:glycosyltransferase family 2 protein [Lachnospiraceae bacterium]